MSICENCGHQNSENLRLSPSGFFTVQNLPPAEQRTALAKIQSEIARYKTYLERLEEEQSTLEASLALLVYPVLTLPTEITSRIFVDCLPTHGRIIPSPSTAPLVLAQICRHWRDIALSTCKLWSSIYVTSIEINMPKWHSRTKAISNDHARHLLDTWLSRAKGHPLSLGFNFPFTRLPSSLMSFITAFSAQIQRLELHMPRIYSQEFHEFHDFRARFPLLRRLATSHLTQEDQHNLLNSSPPLRELRVLNYSYTLNASLPFLTSLEMNLDSTEAFLSILTNFPLLAHLKCSVNSAHSAVVAGTPPPIFPHLSSLAIRGFEAAGALCLVTLPNLCALEIPDPARQDAHDLVARSSCTVRRLVFAIHHRTSEEELSEWFELFPALEALEIRDCHDVAFLIDFLNGPSILPNVSDMAIRASRTRWIQPLSYDALIPMLRSRRKLESFVLDIHDPIGEHDSIRQYSWFPGTMAAEGLEALIAGGLNFRVTLERSSNNFESWSHPSIGSEREPPHPFP